MQNPAGAGSTPQVPPQQNGQAPQQNGGAAGAAAGPANPEPESLRNLMCNYIPTTKHFDIFDTIALKGTNIYV
jgi:hypothetical protein